MDSTFQRNGSFERLFKSLRKQDREWMASQIYLARTSGGYLEYPEEQIPMLNTCIGLVNMAMDNDFNAEVDTIVCAVTEIDRIEDEFGIEILETPPRPKCIQHGECECNGLITKREFLWDYRPRAKDIARGELGCSKVLCLNMCDKHYWKLVDENGGMQPTTAGWDEWDAIDGLLGARRHPRKRTLSQMNE